MKIFGKELFNFQKPAGVMYDFAKFGILNNDNFTGLTQAVWDNPIPSAISSTSTTSIEKPKKEKPKKTPKQLFKLKAHKLIYLILIKQVYFKDNFRF